MSGVGEGCRYGRRCDSELRGRAALLRGDVLHGCWRRHVDEADALLWEGGFVACCFGSRKIKFGRRMMDQSAITLVTS